MLQCRWLVALALFISFLLNTLSAAEKAALDPHRRQPAVFVTTQMGLSNGFQLNLGGFFGPGPAVQSRVQVGVRDLFTRGDSLALGGNSSTDRVRGESDFDFSLWYHRNLLEARGQRLRGGIALVRYVFPSVGIGTRDWGYAGQLEYATKLGRLPLRIVGDSRTTVQSAMPLGTFLAVQAQTSHVLTNHDRLRITLRHGPSYVHSWGMYHKFGHRVLRYGGTLMAERGPYFAEFSYRQQAGLQPGIPDNRLWTVSFGYSWAKPLQR